MDTRRTILTNAKTLRQTKFNRVYICPDLTPAQRETDAKLREQLYTRRQAGEKNLLIRRGKIVKATIPLPAPDHNNNKPANKRTHTLKPHDRNSENTLYSDISASVSEQENMPDLGSTPISASETSASDSAPEEDIVNESENEPTDHTITIITDTQHI